MAWPIFAPSGGSQLKLWHMLCMHKVWVHFRCACSCANGSLNLVIRASSVKLCH